MKISERLDQLHLKARENIWLGYFAICLRIGLAIGFFPSGLVKILGERFTALPNIHPMGAYLEALHHTGFYYTFVGIGQVTAAILLLIPRTTTLGALLYFPIILNIAILSIAVRFEGSLFSSPLMVLANLYLIFWDYHKIKYIFPFHHSRANQALPILQKSRKFPFLFFACVFTVMVSVMLLAFLGFEIKPRVTYNDCISQCEGSDKPEACLQFCDCVYKVGQPLDSCIQTYENAPKTRK